MMMAGFTWSFFLSTAIQPAIGLCGASIVSSSGHSRNAMRGGVRSHPAAGQLVDWDEPWGNPSPPASGPSPGVLCL